MEIPTRGRRGALALATALMIGAALGGGGVLVGFQAAAGPAAAGEQGPAGPKGETGPAGPQGETGQKGDRGEKGEPGEPGQDVQPASTLVDAPFQGGYVLGDGGACPSGTRQWQTVYVLQNDPIGSIGDTQTKAMALCQVG